MHRSAATLVIAAILVIAIAPVGAPVTVSHVYSDSMAPTIGVDDGYVLVPAGTVSPGDIVTFWSPGKDAHVTHRVVDRTADGFVTKGDNNPTTDQRGGHPPVARDQIVGAVLTVGGDPVLVPGLGGAIRAVQAHVAVVATLLVGAAIAFGRSGAARNRAVPRTRDVVQPVFAVGLLAIAGLLALGQASHEFTYVAVAQGGPARGDTVIPVGTATQASFVVEQQARPLLTRVADTHGLANATVTANATGLTVSGTVPPPAETGPVGVRVSVATYPAVLPRWLLARLHAVQPSLASGAVAAVLLGPLWALARLVADPRTPLRHRPSRTVSILRGQR